MLNRFFAVVLFIALFSSTVSNAADALLGSPEYRPTPERPVGWRGDWTGHFTGATPPTVWSRRAMGITSEIRYQADKPAGEPGRDCQRLEYFTIKDWLVAGPFSVDDPVKDLDKDFLGGEATVLPAKDAKAGTANWTYLRADVETQSRHECNNGTCGNTNVDFLYAYGKLTVSPKYKVVAEGTFLNKFAYAHTYIHSPADGKVQLQLPFAGTAGRFWLNGKPADLDLKNRNKPFDVTLNKGWNRLLIKLGTDDAIGREDFSAWLVAAYLVPAMPVSYETKNINWMTKMTGRSMSQPIIVGDKIFVGSGISDLLCLDKKTGKVLWMRSNTPDDGLTAEERAAVPDLKEKTEALVAKLNSANDALVAAINAAISPQGLSSTQQAVVDAKAKDKLTAERAVHDAFNKLDRKKFPQVYLNEVASSNATPVSDGKFVYWVCGGAQYVNFPFVVGCFDLDGKRIWCRYDASMKGNEHGNHLSPVLVDGKLIYGCGYTRVAYDAKTGADVWRNDDKKDWTNQVSAPLIAKIGNENYLLSGKIIYRVSDGTIVGPSNINAVFTNQTMIIENGVVYANSVFQGHGKPPSFTAVKLEAGAKPETLWAPEGKDVWMPVRHNTIAESYSVASPLFVDGLVYSIDMTGGLMIADPAAKKSVHRQWLDGYDRFNRTLYGNVASPTLAGKNIYITDDAGYTHILQPGPQAKELYRNVLENIHLAGAGGNPCKQESFYTSPYFEGKCMYLRGEEYLYCIEEKQ